MINRKDNEKKKRRHGRGPRSIMGKDGVTRAPSIFVVIITTVAFFFLKYYLLTFLARCSIKLSEMLLLFFLPKNKKIKKIKQ